MATQWLIKYQASSFDKQEEIEKYLILFQNKLKNFFIEQYKDNLEKELPIQKKPLVKHKI